MDVAQPGVLVVEGGRSGTLAFADARALELLGCADRAALEALWSAHGGRIEEAKAGERRLTFDWRDDPGGGGVLLIHDAAAAESLAADLRQASLLRSLAQITPAVAHDLRAPINAMVFNIEVLKETIAAGKGAEPGGRERQLRYVNVLREELHRLHQGLEIYVAQISPRGDRDETLDLRELVNELAALFAGPARKQQARVVPRVPDAPVKVRGNRHLIRQALLHLAVAALGGVPRDGALEISLESRDGKALVRIAGGGRGTREQLWAARSILAGLGGEVRPVEASGGPPAYEVELESTQDAGSQEKE